jgi:hypothetical protein
MIKGAGNMRITEGGGRPGTHLLPEFKLFSVVSVVKV